MKQVIELDTKEIRKIIAKFFEIKETDVTPNRYSYSVTGVSADEIQKKLT